MNKNGSNATKLEFCITRGVVKAWARRLRPMINTGSVTIFRLRTGSRVRMVSKARAGLKGQSGLQGQSWLKGQKGLTGLKLTILSRKN